MKQNFIKTFVSALAGSILLVVAMFAMNAMRPETQVVQAATAVQAPALADSHGGATEYTSATLSHTPEAPKYNFEAKKAEGITFTIVRDKDAHIPMTATLYITSTHVGTEWILDDGDGTVTSTKNIDAKIYPGTYPITASLVQTETVDVGILKGEVTVVPIFKFDSGVPAEIKLGDCYTPMVKIQPEVNYITDTNEKVDYDFGNKMKGGVVITDTSVFTADGKGDKLDSTYVFTRHRYYVGGMTYTVKAIYNSGVYGKMSGEITKTLYVENPEVKVWVTDMDGEVITTTKSGEMVRAWAETSHAISPTMMYLKTSADLPPGAPEAYFPSAMLPMTGTKVYTDVTVPELIEGVEVLTVTVGADLLSSMYGGETSSISKELKLITSASTPLVVEKAPPPPPKVTEVDLSNAPASPIKAGESYTVTATLMDADSKPVTGTNVMFKVTDADSNAEIKSENKTSDDAGKAEITVTSSEVATYTVIAVSEGVTSTKQLTLMFESGENTKQIDPTKDEDVEMTSEDGKVTITIESGTFTETVDIVFEEASENDADVQGKIGSLKAKTRFGFFRIKFYKVNNGQRGDQFFPVLSKPIKIVYNRLTVASTMLQQTNEVPLNEVQLLKIATYTTSWNNMDTTVSPSSPSAGDALTLTGSTTQPGELFAVVTANNEVYLPTVSK
jgi:hypothetical protein